MPSTKSKTKSGPQTREPYVSERPVTLPDVVDFVTLDPGQSSSQPALPWLEAALRPGDAYLEPIAPLGQPLAAAHRVMEYDFATVLPIRDLLAHGRTGDERLLLYPQGHETALLFVEGVRERVQTLAAGETLLVRLDRVCLLPPVAEALAQELFYRDRVGGRLSLDKHVVLVNADPSTTLALHRAMELENDMCMALTTDQEPWRLTYLGTFQSHLRAALEYVRAHPDALAREVSAGLGVSDGDTGRRLRELVENGLIDRIAHAGKVGKPAYTHAFYHPFALYHAPDDDTPLTYGVYVPWATERGERLLLAAENALLQKKYSLATTLSEKYLSLQRDLDDRAGMAGALRQLGVIAVRQRQFARGEALLDEALVLLRQLPDRAALSDALHSRGFAAAQQGQGQTALFYYDQALQIRREIGNKDRTASTLNNMANVHAAEGRFGEAFVLGAQSLELRAYLGDNRDIAQSLLSCARLAYHQGKAERFLVLYTAGIKLQTEIQLPIPTNDEEAYREWLAAMETSLDAGERARARQAGMEMSLEELVAYATRPEETK